MGLNKQQPNSGKFVTAKTTTANPIKFEKKPAKQVKKQAGDKDSNDGNSCKESTQPTKMQNWRSLSNIGASKKSNGVAYQQVNKSPNPAQKDDDETKFNDESGKDEQHKDLSGENIKNLICHELSSEQKIIVEH